MPSHYRPVARALLVLAAAAIGLERTPAAFVTVQALQPAFDVTEKSIEELRDAMSDGKVTSRQLVEAYLARIDAYDKRGPSLNAIMAVNPHAREAAASLDTERRARGPRGPLHGIPVLVKDNYETIEMPTTAGSIALASFHPARDAVLVQRLKSAGAVILGKTTMHELAAGIVTVGSGFGRTRNPYDLDRNPGGSSGGTGAAIAASFAAAGMGSDTCGSIRNPASHNNLVGLRATQGLASGTGIVPLSITQDIGGPIARTVEDLATVLDATVGPDPGDASTAAAGHVPKSYRALLSAGAIKGARIGVVRSLFGSAPEDQEVTTLVNKALEAMKTAGAELMDVAVPGLDDLLRNSSMIPYDFKFDLAAYLAGTQDAPVKSLGEILDRGLYHAALESTFRMRNAVESRDTDAARRARIKRVAIRQALESVLAEHRLVALLYPTLRRKPARIGDAQPGTTCQLSAHSGLPALGIPAGFTADGLPIGVDLLGGAFTEADLLSLGHAIQEVLRLRRAPFSTPPLVNGQPPAPKSLTLRPGSIALTLTYDQTTSRLQFELTGDRIELLRLGAVWIAAGTPRRPGALRHRLFAAGMPWNGTLTLAAADREGLARNNLMVRFFRTNDRAPSTDVSITF